MKLSREVEWEHAIWRQQLHARIDARADAALRVIHALAQRDRRANGQYTRFDHVMARAGAPPGQRKGRGQQGKTRTTGTAD